MKSVIILFALLASGSAFCQQPTATEKNIVYGMVDGASLLMDVYTPAVGNHKGIIMIPGSAYGYTYAGTYDDDQLKEEYYFDSGYIGKWARMLVGKGYTVFIINHRFAPKFHYAQVFADCQRAVRFIRYNAAKFGIDPKRLGAVGHSSGASLCAMLGVTDTLIANAANGIDSCSSKVQAVVTLAAPFDLADYNKKEDTAINSNLALNIMVSYMGELPPVKKGLFIRAGRYAEASPISHVSHDDAAFLIYYSDNDPIIPPRQAKAMYEKLVGENVPAEIFLSKGTRHTPLPDTGEVDNWFKKYL